MRGNRAGVPGSDEAAQALDSADIEGLELGERASWGLLMERFATVYSAPADREFAMTMLIFGHLVNGGVGEDDPRWQQAMAYAERLDEGRQVALDRRDHGMRAEHPLDHEVRHDG